MKEAGKEGTSTHSLSPCFLRLSFFLSWINPSSPYSLCTTKRNTLLYQPLPPPLTPTAQHLYPHIPPNSYEPDLSAAKRALAVMEARHVLQRVKAQGLDMTNERYGLYYRFVDPWQARDWWI